MHRSPAILETLLQHAPIGFGFIDREFRYLRVNKLLSEFNAVSEAEMIGRRVADVVPHLWPSIEPLYRRALAGEVISENVIAGPTNATLGESRYWQVSYYPVRLDGEIIGLGIIVADVNDRIHAERALGIRNNLYAMLSRTNLAVSRCQSPDELYREICSIAVDVGRFRFAWIGVPRDNRIIKIADAGNDAGYLDNITITLDEHDPRSHGPTGRAAVTGRSFIVNDFMNSSMTAPWQENARRVGFAASAAFPLLERGKVVAVFTLYAEVPGFFSDDLVATLSEIPTALSFALDRFLQEAERRRDEAELHLRDRALRAVSQGIIITDPRLTDNPIIYANPGFETLTGYSAAEIVGQNCRFLIGKDTDPQASAQLRHAIRNGQSCNVELLNYRKDGSTFWNNLNVSPVLDHEGQVTHFVGVQKDVTQRRLLEAQLRQAQKMEAVGQLAGGIAHDFNNLLTIINGYSQVLLQDPKLSSPQRELLEEIQKAGQQSALLTRQLLAFSRKQVLEPKVLDLNDVVRNTEKMLRRVIGEDVRLITSLAPGLHPVKADPGQLEQVLLNLAVNARDAMPQGGTLSISTANVDSSPSQGSRDQTPSPAVLLTVSDSGIGITPEIHRHLFEPFFTTKGPGKGTGLGLAVVHGIVQQSDGQIEVHSRPGHGAAFHIYLPKVDSPSISTRASRPLDRTPLGTETILLVEDAEQVRRLTRKVLEDAGYTVLDAPAPDAALRIAASPIRIDLLVTDVVMPGLGGQLLADKIRSLHPGIKTLFVSGYTDDDVVRHGVSHEEVNFLAKPFTPNILACKVRDILDAPPRFGVP